MEKAQHSEEMEFCLPSELNYDDFFAEGKKWKDDGEIPFLFASNPHSPLDSVTETETESDDDEDYLARLTQSMAHSFLLDDEENSDDSVEVKDTAQKTKSAEMSVSPQSTLRSGWTVSKKLPPSSGNVLPAEKQEEKVQDLQSQLHQVIKLEIIARQQKIKNSTPASPATYNNTVGTFFRPAINYHRSPAAAWAAQNKSRNEGIVSGNYRALGLPSSAWPPLQKQPPSAPQKHQSGSAVRAVFLNAPGIKKESAGTGVFLPRLPGSKPEPRRKTACSPVLVPARVVQALNLNLEQLGAQPRYTNAGVYAGYVLNRDALLSRTNNFALNQKQRVKLTPQNVSVASPDIHLLPHEWTY